MAVQVNGGALEFDAVINASQFNAAIASIEKQLAGLTQTAQKEASIIDNLVRKTTTAIAGYAAFIGSTNFVGDIVRVRGEFQQLEVAFRTMLGSKAKADELLAQVTEFAATTPFELQDVAKATKQLLAFGISSDKVVETLRSLGDVSAGISAPLGDIAYLFGTIKTQGVALTQDIRQFASRGIPIYEELAKILGVSTEEVNSFISAGKIGFPEIEQVFKNLTAEGSKFGGLMEAQSKTLTGQISNLRDAWSQMLNEIGKGGEGLFSDIIKGATYLVKNFDEVIKILKVLVITYGTYKAAVIATNIATAIATAATKGYTVAEILRYNAMLLSERAMKILNATMLKNPFVAVATGIAALVSALTIFSNRTTEAQRRQKALNEVTQEANRVVVQETNQLKALLSVAQDETKSKQDRETAIRKINQLSPEYLGNLTLENLKTAEGKKLIDEYINALKRKATAQAISNKLTELEGKRLELEQKQLAFTNRVGFFNRAIGADIDGKLAENNRQLEFFAQKQKELTEEEIKTDNKKQEVKQRTIAVIDEEIKATKELQQANSTSAAQYNTYQQKINALEAERRAIVGASKSDIAANNKLENQANSLLEARKNVLEQIEDLKRNSDRSGLVKEQTELDRINERYDEVIKNITEYNKKVDEFNKKNPKSQVQKVGQADIQKLNDARSNELDNTRLKEDADRYKKHLEEQQQLFARFEEAKKEVGLEKARELFGEQTKNYTTFLELLNEEAAKLLPKITLGIANIGEVNKFKAIIDQIHEYNKTKNEQQVEEEKQKFLQLLDVTTTYEDKKSAINKKYDDLEAELKKNSTLKQLEERQKLLEQGRQDEINQLNDDTATQLQVFQRLFAGIENLSEAAARKVIADARAMLAQLLAEGKISEDLANEITRALEQASVTLDQRFPDRLQKLSSALGNMADQVGSFNEGLSQSLALLSDIIQQVGNVKNSISDFKKSKKDGDVLGQISAGLGIAGAAVGIVTSIIGFFKKRKEERERQKKEMQEFLTAQLKGEQEINRLYRERALEQVKLNKLKIQGLQDERELLLLQKQQVAANYADVYAQLQQLTAKVAKSNGRGFTTISLFGKSYEDLQKLFLSGQLEGKAKELFQLLEQLKTEGADIDKLLEENKRQAQELFTGTTADSISDAIIEGFKAGKRSASDFAGTFEDLMRQALIQSLKFKYLEGPLKEFFEAFAAASESDGQLTSAEIAELQNTFNTIIGNANQQFQQLQQIAGLNFNSTNAGASNSLTGAIKGMTEQQAELLAGQFGGLRLTALDILAVSRQQLSALNNIQSNTASTVVRMNSLLDKFNTYETGQRKLHVIV